jgi:hypothetical protein
MCASSIEWYLECMNCLQVTFFLYLIFLLNGIDNLLSNLTWIWMCFSSIDWYRERMVYLDILPLLVPLQPVAFSGLFFFFCFHGYIRHESACFWVSVVRYALHHFAYQIGRWVVYLVPEKKATLWKKSGRKSIHFRKCGLMGSALYVFTQLCHSCRRLLSTLVVGFFSTIIVGSLSILVVGTTHPAYPRHSNSDAGPPCWPSAG